MIFYYTIKFLVKDKTSPSLPLLIKEREALHTYFKGEMNEMR